MWRFDLTLFVVDEAGISPDDSTSPSCGLESGGDIPLPGDAGGSSGSRSLLDPRSLSSLDGSSS